MCFQTNQQFLQQISSQISQYFNMSLGTTSKFSHKYKIFRKRKEDHDLKIGSGSVLISTHSLIQSEAQILLPSTYKFYKTVGLFAKIICEDKIIWAQINDASYSDKKIKEISIVQNLTQLHDITRILKPLKGEISIIERDDMPSEYHLAFAEILVKEVYVSRRDQYKIIKYIENHPLHVYNRKGIYFDGLKLEFTNLLDINAKIVKSGLVDKSTKLIFRTCCAKYSILFEIAEEMFEINEKNQLYLEKAIRFLQIFFLRNSFFQTDHRIEIVLFARVFYLEFGTLNEALDALNGPSKKQKNSFPINYASSLQKDYKGRIYQDAYRRILWNKNNIETFKLVFTKKVSEFLFTLNLKDRDSYSRFMKAAIYQHNREKPQINYPYIHKLSGILARSEQACLFEGISLISEQYKHHHIFRSLKETGNSIMIVSAGRSKYKVDKTTYKMAKSNVYLTNIHTILINLKHNHKQIQAEIIQLKNRPIYYPQHKSPINYELIHQQFSNVNSVNRLRRLVDWHKEMIAYKTPKSILLSFPDQKFELKSVVYGDRFEEISQKQYEDLFEDGMKWSPEPEPQREQKPESSQNSKFYINKETTNEKFKIKNQQCKKIKWIRTLKITEYSFNSHNIVYSEFPFNWVPFTETKNPKTNDFQRDLAIIINKKSDYCLSNLCEESQASVTVNSYIEKLQRQKGKERSNNKQDSEENYLQEMRSIRARNQSIGELFSASSNNYQVPLKIRGLEKFKKFQFFDEKGTFNHLHHPEQVTFYPSGEESSSSRLQSQLFDLLGIGELNIFEETYLRGQYIRNAHQEGNQIDLSKVQHFRHKPLKNYSHNKFRLKNNYLESPIHYMMTYYSSMRNQSITDQIQTFKKSSGYWKLDGVNLDEEILLQKEWKDIVFPLLTPIYNSFIKREDNQSHEQRVAKYSREGQFVAQEEVCKYLMENFQIDQRSNHNNINLAKGHVQVSLYINEKYNVMTFENIDSLKQSVIIPKMFYRYLSFEEKDLRFGSKFICFSDENYYDEEVKQSKKSIKMVFFPKEPNQAEYESIFTDFIAFLQSKYPEINLKVAQTSDRFVQPSKKKFSINLGADQNHEIYKHEIVHVILDEVFHHQNLFTIVIEWDYCCAIYINQLLRIVGGFAHKCRLHRHLVSNENPFQIKWDISTVSQLLMSCEVSVFYLEKWIERNCQWLWNSDGYYMDRKGLAFVRIVQDKHLVEWKDNELEKQKWQKPEQQSNKFSELIQVCEIIDTLGRALDSIGLI